MIVLTQSSGVITLRQASGAISLSIGKGTQYSFNFTLEQNSMYLILL